jgi:hypothetical protein
LEQHERDWIAKFRAAIQEPKPSKWERTKELSKSAAAYFVNVVRKITGRRTTEKLQAAEPHSIPKQQEHKSDHVDAA